MVGVLNLYSGSVLVFIQENAGKRIAYYSVEAAKKWISTSCITSHLEVLGKYSFYGGIILDFAKSLQNPAFIGKASLNTAVNYGAYVIGGTAGFWIGGTYLVLDKTGVINVLLDSGIKMHEQKSTSIIQSDRTSRYNPYIIKE